MRRSGSAFSRFKEKARRLIERQKSPPAPIQNLEAITAHIEKYFGRDFFVFDEKKSHVVHIDVMVVLPSASRPWYTLLTSGMSDLPMRAPRTVKDSALAEVCLCLPKEWPISQADTKWATPEFFWPIRLLKEIARYPHLNDTWLSHGHTVSQAGALDPAARFAGLVIAKPTTFPNGAELLQSDDGRKIRYLAVIPLLKDELAFKLEFGTDALQNELEAAGVTELLNPQRQTVISR
jgi:hypothetical protein